MADQTVKCVPADGAADGSLHWLSLGSDMDVYSWHTDGNGHEYWCWGNYIIGTPKQAYDGAWRYIAPALLPGWLAP